MNTRFTRTLFGHRQLTHLPGIRQVALLGHCIVISADRSFNGHAGVRGSCVVVKIAPVGHRCLSRPRNCSHGAFVNLRRAFDVNEHRIILNEMIYSKFLLGLQAMGRNWQEEIQKCIN